MPLSESRDRAMHFARGVASPRWLVDGADGKPLTVPDLMVRELSAIENAGLLDEPLGGNMARLQGAELLAAIGSPALAEAFAPLFPAASVEKAYKNQMAIVTHESLGEGVPTAPTKAELLEAGRPSLGHVVSPWVLTERVRAASAKDVREREERGADDRPSWEISRHASNARAVVMAARKLKGAPSFNFARTKTAPVISQPAPS